MYNNIFFWVEKYFYNPNTTQKIISYLLLPISFLYCLLGKIKRYIIKPKKFGIPIISVGNLTVGGSGKTPFCIALSNEFENTAIILRGYKRASSGLIVVKNWNDILCDTKTSGDEAMLYAQNTNACVIVSENRIQAIQKAKKLGARLIILDDGFSKVNISKFDILIYPNPVPANSFCIPSGVYREPISNYKNVNLVAYENIDFSRTSYISNQTENMVLVTAIANPQRLDKFLPQNIKDKFIFPDHYMYEKDELIEILNATKASSILTTKKDAVKMQNFNLPLSILELDFKIFPHVITKINTYIKNDSTT